MTVFCKGKEVHFESNFSDESAYDTLRLLVSSGKLTSDFAKSLAKLHFHELSSKQWAWVHKLVVDHEKPQLKEKFEAIYRLFQVAKASGLKRPKIVVSLEGLPTVRFHVAGSMSKYPGTVQVKIGSQWYCRIMHDGSIQGSVPEDLMQVLRKFNSDPVGIATVHAWS